MRIISILLLFFLCFSLDALEYTVVSNKAFPFKNLTSKQLKSIYLKKVTYINGIEILAINISATNKLRENFEDKVLHMNKRAIKKYWFKAQYNGVRPPKVLKSYENVLSYLSKIQGAIAYVPKEYPLHGLNIIKIQK